MNVTRVKDSVCERAQIVGRHAALNIHSFVREMEYDLTRLQRTVSAPMPKLAVMPAKKTSDLPAPSKVLTAQEINGALDGHVLVNKLLWPRLAYGNIVRFFVRGEQPRCERLRAPVVICDNKKGRFIVRLLSGKCRSKRYTMDYDEVDELWKRYPQNALVEMHMIQASLAQKKQQLMNLEERLKRLEARQHG